MRFFCLIKRITLLLLFLVKSQVAYAQFNGVYIGGPMWYGEQTTFDAIKASGFNEVILWAIHVDPSNGDLYLNMPEPWNRVTLFSEGEWIDNPDNNNFLSNLRSLKQGQTSVVRLTWSIGTSFDDDFQSIETLVDSQGTGTDSILYRNFQALKTQMPFIDALDYDDERNYDEPSTTQFSIMVSDLGYKIAFSPYTRTSFWRDVFRNTEAARPGTIDTIHLQCYAGGSGNNPATWNRLFPGLQVSPGLQAPNLSASGVADRMRGWENSTGIAGGFMWLWDAIEDGDAPNSPSDYAAAIQPVVNALEVPGIARSPRPRNSATNVATSIDLSWTGGANATSHDVYFGTVNPPELVRNQSRTSYDPGQLDANTTYFWRVDAVNSAGTTAGGVWQFTTGGVSTSNLAPEAVISVSSEYEDANWSRARLTDGITGQNGNGEWASGGEVTPWAQLDWSETIVVDRIVLFDRPTDIESIASGTLTFSDGSSVSVGTLPDNGTALEVNFAPKTITWVRFQVDEGEGPNNGLSEFEVYGAYTANGR